ncbi:hypothetical protein MSAN_01922900 [Mycena sanguinolenta]|uniref:Uncharacterized protein n=1 Tax=Mycena sanguinolenta TaxID=230812 RepID=A0A8H6XNR6_9AGAR|nr:hypothetical protein MSAN_01922900 [Mycena sanguinolenta]
MFVHSDFQVDSSHTYRFSPCAGSVQHQLFVCSVYCCRLASLWFRALAARTTSSSSLDAQMNWYHPQSLAKFHRVPSILQQTCGAPPAAAAAAASASASAPSTSTHFGHSPPALLPFTPLSPAYPLLTACGYSAGCAAIVQH